MTWRFQLLPDDKLDLMALADMLASGPVRVTKDSGLYFLESDAIDAASGDVQERLASARDLMVWMNGWAVTVEPIQHHVRVSGRVITPTGETQVNGGAHADGRSRAHARGIVNDGQEDGRRRVTGAEVIAAARRNPAATDVLQLLGSHPHDLHTLFKVHELIQSAAPDKLKDWAPASERDRFAWSANSRMASDLHARHAVDRKGSPRQLQPMSIDAARELILRIAHQFLVHLAESQSRPEDP